MNNLQNLKSFNQFNNTTVIEEALSDGGQSYINKAFMAGPPILMTDGNLVERKTIVKFVQGCIDHISQHQGKLYMGFVQDFTLIYTLDCEDCPTMLVNDRLELMVNARFVYQNLNMNERLTCGVLLHEVLHVFLDHINRGVNYNMAHGQDPYNKDVAHDNNLAADEEVNKTLVKLSALEKDEIVNGIHGVYLETGHNSEFGFINNILPMEDILSNEKMMEKLRAKFPRQEEVERPGGKPNEVTTSAEWDQGWTDCWNKCSDLIEKYGPDEFLNQLRSNGVMVGLGRVDKSVGIDTVNSMSFINIKSFDEVIEESDGKAGEYQTYEDGFWKCMEDIMKRVMNATSNGPDGPSGSNDDSGDKIKSGVKKEDLKPINLPSKKKEKQSGSKDDNSLTNFKDENGSKDESGDNQQKGESGNGQSGENQGDSNNGSQEGEPGRGNGEENPGNGESSTALRDSIMADQEKGGKKGQPSGSLIDKSSVGKTGGMMKAGGPNDHTKKILEKSGYTQEQINEISKIVEKHKAINTPEAIQKKRADLVNSLGKGNPISIRFEEGLKAAEQYKDLWEKLLKKFMHSSSTFAGTDIVGDNFRWGDKRRMSLGMISPYMLYEEQTPQFINMYPDVSFSVSIPILKAVSEALYTFMIKFQYSGINIVPWAINTTGSHIVKSVYTSKSKNAVVDEIIGYIEDGHAKGGGGTELIKACVPEIVSNNSQNKKNVHIIITDGQVGGDVNGIEALLQAATKNKDINKRCIWMIYDASDSLKSKWKNEIKKGQIVFLSSSLFK